ncbi:hypothetical protein DEF28_26945, partial [Marinitenerispora sediminis]
DPAPYDTGTHSRPPLGSGYSPTEGRPGGADPLGDPAFPRTPAAESDPGSPIWSSMDGQSPQRPASAPASPPFPGTPPGGAPAGGYEPPSSYSTGTHNRPAFDTGSHTRPPLDPA